MSKADCQNSARNKNPQFIYWLTDVITKGSSDDPSPDEFNPEQEDNIE